MATTQNARPTRDMEVREQSDRPEAWVPPETLPVPTPKAGFTRRYVRLSMMGEIDDTNYDKHYQEGYRMVLASEQPHIQTSVVASARFSEGVVVGGLLLMEIPTEHLRQRAAYYAGKTVAQVQAVDNDLMKENDPRMPLFRERESRVTFGKGSV